MKLKGREEWGMNWKLNKVGIKKKKKATKLERKEGVGDEFELLKKGEGVKNLTNMQWDRASCVIKVRGKMLDIQRFQKGQ